MMYDYLVVQIQKPLPEYQPPSQVVSSFSRRGEGSKLVNIRAYQSGSRMFDRFLGMQRKSSSSLWRPFETPGSQCRYERNHYRRHPTTATHHQSNNNKHAPPPTHE